jgi:cell division cycle 2-like protein
MDSPYSRPDSPVSSHIWADQDSDEDNYQEDVLKEYPGLEEEERKEQELSKKRKRSEMDVEDNMSEENMKYFTERWSRPVEGFRRLNKIDEGAYGVVYRVKNLKTGHTVALKKVKIKKEGSRGEGFPLTALREVDLLMSCHHRNVVNVYETVVGRSRDEVFLVMEFVEHDLRTLMEQRSIRFTAPEVKCLMRQLLEALEYLHAHFVLHRDLKTSNILLTSKGVLKVCDFGMARYFTDPLQAITPLAWVLTLPYRPPEGLIRGTTPMEYGPAVDIWSCGCIFAELLSNKPLFRPTSEPHLLTLMCQLLGTPTDETWPGWSSLEIHQKWKIVQHPAGELRKRFPQGGTGFDGSRVCVTQRGGFGLLQDLLAMCPDRRITASEALGHYFFIESPLPASEEQLAKMLDPLPSLHMMERGHR